MKTKKHSLRKNSKTKRKHIIHVPNSTPIKIRKISRKIHHDLTVGKRTSYAPTINQDLVPIQSIHRKELMDCNMKQAFMLLEPLKIGIPKTGKCYLYNEPKAKKFLLRNLAANKHIDIKKVVPPMQSEANCWFNSMFVNFFVSDKGRKFFHFFRQLMIEGKQRNGTKIPKELRNAFALLNFAVDACLTGNEFAYELNTNAIIRLLFQGIPDSYKQDYPFIRDVGVNGNPMDYYMSLINYLDNRSTLLLYIMNTTNGKWMNTITEYVIKNAHLPHIIVLEIFPQHASEFQKDLSFTVGDAVYEMDSAMVADLNTEHMCATLTCEGKEMGYDGASFHRIVPLSWKSILNKNVEWEFEGNDGMKWNFTDAYQLLMYYRVR
jgi:hypothetical protein